MDDMLHKVRQLKKHVLLLDGYDDHVERKCKYLLENDCKEIVNMLALRKEELQMRRNDLEEQKALTEELKIVNARLAYMKDNVPKECLGNADHANERQSPNGMVPKQIVHQRSPEPSAVSAINYTSPISVPAPDRTAFTVQTPKPRSDMEISISYVGNNEFSEIPDYMKGRLKINDVNSFIDIFNKALTKKYALLKRTKNSIKLKNELEKYVNWKGQINSDTKGLYFCTAEDIFSECGLKFGKKEFSLITILRHLKRIREIRNKKLVFYIACF